MPENKKLNPNLSIIQPTTDAKQTLKQRVEALCPGQWTIPQMLLQEIQATDSVEAAATDSTIPLTKQIEALKVAINEIYNENHEVRDLLLEYLPTYETIRQWTKLDGWEEAVQQKIRSSFKFCNERRAQVWEVIYRKAVDKGDMKAAELFCKLDGQLEANKGKGSKADSDYEEFNRVLHNKKK